MELETKTETQLVQRVRGKVLPRVYPPPSPHSPFSFHYNLKSMRILLLLLQRLIAFLCISNLIKRRFSGQEVSFVSCTYVTDIEKSFPYTIPYHVSITHRHAYCRARAEAKSNNCDLWTCPSPPSILCNLMTLCHYFDLIYRTLCTSICPRSSPFSLSPSLFVCSHKMG